MKCCTFKTGWRVIAKVLFEFATHDVRLFARRGGSRLDQRFPNKDNQDNNEKILRDQEDPQGDHGWPGGTWQSGDGFRAWIVSNADT